MRAWRAHGAPQVVSRVRAWRSRAPSWLLLTISPRDGLGLTTLTKPPMTCNKGSHSYQRTNMYKLHVRRVTGSGYILVVDKAAQLTCNTQRDNIMTFEKNAFSVLEVTYK